MRLLRCIVASVVLFIGCVSSFILEIENTNVCEKKCQESYILHTYEDALHLSFCERGCRLFNIIELVNDEPSCNETEHACVFSCEEAYKTKEDAKACSLGCRSQIKPSHQRKEQLSRVEEENVFEPIDPLYPFLYVHNMYSNMIDKFSSHMMARWSFYMQNNNGRVIIVSNMPRVDFPDDEDFNQIDLDPDNYKTSNYMESNLASVDAGATPNIRQSQLQLHPRSLEGRDEVAFSYQGTSYTSSVDVPDWLTCLANKTGLPRLLLSFTIFISCFMMIWLCLTTIATSPEHRVSSTGGATYFLKSGAGLSINDNLEQVRLAGLDDQLLIPDLDLPQVHSGFKIANALPIKVKVEDI